ncbi:MAG: hypothetical protein WDW38_000501 [Sanguina aurantia]
MKAQGAPQKLRFTIQAVSGEDSDYPVRELLFHSPQTRGWHSPRFCKYPQEILLRLEQPSKIQQIQILSHEYKIATKVEVFVGGPNPGEPDPSQAALKRLGYLSFDSNERSSHQARELKSVHVNVPAYYVRLTIHRCHVNKLNIYNQVAQYDALCLLFLALHNGCVNPTHSMLFDALCLLFLCACLQVGIIALNLLGCVNPTHSPQAGMAVVGQKIAQLEARKRSAVEKEDYDTAKTIKLDIDKLRAAGEAAATHGGGGGGGSSDTSTMRSKNPDDIFNRVLSHRSASTPGVDPQAPPAQPGSLDEVAVGSAFRQMRNSVNGGPPPPSRAEEYEHEPEMEQESSSSNHHSSKHTAYDERPAIGKGIYGEDGEALGGDGGMGQQPNYVAPTVAPGDIIPPPRGWPADLPPPEPLASAVAKEAELLEDMAGEFVARAAFSKNWQLRDAALMHLAKEAEGGGFNDKRDAFKILMRMVQRGMKDKVANVFLTSVSVFTSLVDMYAPVVGPRDVEAASEAALPLIIDKLGDNNARLSAAIDDPTRFKRSRDVAAYFGLTSKRWQSGTSIDVKGRISKAGDPDVRRALYEAASAMLTRFKGSDTIKAWGLKLAKTKCHARENWRARADDPAPFLEELQQRERSLGGDHADVAESCSNLAILYNQRGDTAKALPLYERALKIYEKSYGPHHAEVAHTLTDLAVLHLEQGRDTVGRPLLERALAIQTKALGPDHPDVVAIKDVLNSPDS